jgi:hypothetical protein
MFQNQVELRVPRWALIAIALVLLLSVGSALHNAGWSQGYTQGLFTGSLLTSGAEGGKVAPYLLNQNGYGWHGGHSFGVIGGFFRFLFFGFLIMLAFRFFAFRRWHMHKGENGKHGGHGGPWQHGPWGRHHSQQAEQPQPGNAPAAEAPQPSEHKPQNTSWIDV